MYYMNLAENQGFLVQFLALNVLICYTWRFYWDVSWMLNHRKIQIVQIGQIHKISPNFKIRVYFWFMGLGQFSECGLVYCLLWLRKTSPTSTPTSPSPVNWSHLCAIRVYRLGEWWSSLVCLCYGSVYCASMLACQKCASMPEGHPWGVWDSLDVSRSPRCPEGQVIVPLCQMAQNPQDCTYGANWFVMMILYVFLSHVMAYWLCLSPFIDFKVLVYL